MEPFVMTGTEIFFAHDEPTHRTFRVFHSPLECRPDVSSFLFP
jgi:hypothetical protein